MSHGTGIENLHVGDLYDFHAGKYGSNTQKQRTKGLQDSSVDIVDVSELLHSALKTWVLYFIQLYPSVEYIP